MRQMTRVGGDPYRVHLAAAKLALAQQWDVSVHTASTAIEDWARSLDVKVEEIADFVLDEVYGYWRRHGSPGDPRGGPGPGLPGALE